MQLTKSHLKHYTLPVLSESFWAYLAGFVDGEANIRKYWARTTSVGENYGYEMVISQNRENGGEDVFNWIKSNLEIGHIRLRKLEKPEKDIFYLAISQREALQKIWRKILPYTHIKTKIIVKMLDDIEQVYSQTAMHG